MMNKSTGIFLVVLTGSLIATVSGHWKNKDRKLSGIHHHLLGTRGERCPPGTKLVFSSSSTDLLTGNFSARCDPANAEMSSSPFRSSNSLIQSNTAFDVPNFKQSSAVFQPADIFRPFPGIVLPSGHQSTGFSNRAALSTELLLRERGLHEMLSKLARHSHKHRENKSKF